MNNKKKEKTKIKTKHLFDRRLNKIHNNTGRISANVDESSRTWGASHLADVTVNCIITIVNSNSAGLNKDGHALPLYFLVSVQRSPCTETQMDLQDVCCSPICHPQEVDPSNVSECGGGDAWLSEVPGDPVRFIWS
jgi:hypothetical protein